MLKDLGIQGGDALAEAAAAIPSPPRVLVVTSMYPSEERPAFGNFVRRQVEALRAAGSIQEVLQIEGWRSRTNYLRAIGRIRRAVNSGRHDLVHAYYGLCGFVAACQSRLPLVVTYCGSDLNPGYAGRERAPLKSRVIIALGQAAAVRARRCLVRSREMQDRLLWPGARARARIIVSGLDLELFRPEARTSARRRLGWEEDRPTVLFVCSDPSLPAVKRPELARAVLSEVRKAVPGAELKIAAGLTQAALPAYYNAADLLLLTSANEGSPNVVREALACGLPVVSTRVGDVQEVLEGLRGCWVCDADPIALSSRVVEVLMSRERTDPGGRLAGTTLEAVTRAILETYREALVPPERGHRSTVPERRTAS
ncbi:MAG TPA: glycosyltransferase [Candidatus Polarisedimenticolia bacterium]|nr:glycosyltransferase [Candidatus Polarisedimenticolia bacterium]